MNELNVESVFCSGRLPSVDAGLGLMEGWGRPNDVANGLLEPVGVGFSDCCCWLWLFVAHGLLLPGCRGASCGPGDGAWSCCCCCGCCC